MQDISQILVDFNEKGKKIFFSLYDQFRQTAKRLDRTKDNNVFQQQEGKYLATLKHQLESLAVEMMNKNKTIENTSQLNKKLTDTVNQFLSEFQQKSRSL
jgi:flagellar biosynthesis component FlhA